MSESDMEMRTIQESLPLDENALSLLAYIREAREQNIERLPKDMMAFENLYQVAKAFERETLILLDTLIGMVSQHCAEWPGPDPIHTDALSANEDAIYVLEQRKLLERYKGKMERWFWTEKAKKLEIPK